MQEGNRGKEYLELMNQSNSYTPTTNHHMMSLCEDTNIVASRYARVSLVQNEIVSQPDDRYGFKFKIPENYTKLLHLR